MSLLEFREKQLLSQEKENWIGARPGSVRPGGEPSRAKRNRTEASTRRAAIEATKKQVPSSAQRKCEWNQAESGCVPLADSDSPSGEL